MIIEIPLIIIRIIGGSIIGLMATYTAILAYICILGKDDRWYSGFIALSCLAIVLFFIAITLLFEIEWRLAY
jgi:hypothetical protein